MDHERSKNRAPLRPRDTSTPDRSQEPINRTWPLLETDAVNNSEGLQQPFPRSKYRIKLWDSFKQKTRKIRVRTKEKIYKSSSSLDKRATSHPNISSLSSSQDGESKISFVSDTDSPRLVSYATLPANGPVIKRDQAHATENVARRQTSSRTISRSYVALSEISSETFSSDVGTTVSAASTEYSQQVWDSPDWSLGQYSRQSEDRDGPRSRNFSLGKDIVDSQEDDGSRLADRPGTRHKQGVSEESPHHSDDQHMPDQHSKFMLKIHLQEGRDLVIRDSCGTSDPYVRFRIGNKQVYKSKIIYRNLNPCWDEHVTLPVDDVTKPLIIRVLDYDLAVKDDPMGGCELNLSTLEVNKSTDLKLMLSETGKEEYMGYLLLSCTLVPRLEENTTDQEQSRNSSIFRRSTGRTESNRKPRTQEWSGVVTIALLEGSDLVAMDDNGFSDPYVKFKLGLDKYRSKVKPKTLNPQWREQFDLHLYDNQTTKLELEVYDHDTRGKDDFMGRAVIDLSLLARETTHLIDQKLEDGAGSIKLLVTISGTVGTELTSDLANYAPSAQGHDSLVYRYGLLNSFTSFDDVGCLEVKVFKAHGLHAADFGGLSDPFCVLELGNERVQTQTEYKTLNPEWFKVFIFRVKDIHSVLEITVNDEDWNKKAEFLGKVVVPLLQIRNGERRWYALKDSKLIHKAKGAILLEMSLVFNHIKAAIRTINPKEEKYIVPEQKFRISTMKENISRVSQLITVVMDTRRFIQSCFDWQSPPRTITAFIVYLVIVWNFELYMLPVSLLLILAKSLLLSQLYGMSKKETVEDDNYIEQNNIEDDDEDDKDKDEKKSILERYHAIQDVCLTVQQALDTVASLGERIKNTFNWSVPWLSVLAVIALLAGSIILYFIPLRYLLLAWGINKFTKKLRKPNAIPNNELLDFLSRVPSDQEMLHYKELRPDIPANTTQSRKKRS